MKKTLLPSSHRWMVMELPNGILAPGKAASFLKSAHPDCHGNDSTNAETLGQHEKTIEELVALVLVKQLGRLKNQGHFLYLKTAAGEDLCAPFGVGLPSWPIFHGFSIWGTQTMEVSGAASLVCVAARAMGQPQRGMDRKGGGRGGCLREGQSPRQAQPLGAGARQMKNGNPIDCILFIIF